MLRYFSLKILSLTSRSREVEVTSSTDLIYDFYGFGQEYYKFKWSAPQDVPLAEKIVDLLKDSGVKATLDAKRGIDHGTWLPLAIMYPNADVPLVQVSLKKGLKFEDQAATGKALAPLIKEGYWLIGRYATSAWSHRCSTLAFTAVLRHTILVLCVS